MYRLFKFVEYTAYKTYAEWCGEYSVANYWHDLRRRL